jgi:hypothetical protein
LEKWKQASRTVLLALDPLLLVSSSGGETLMIFASSGIFPEGLFAFLMMGHSK